MTGANSGMGKETARELARMGAAVVLGCRSLERGETAADDIKRTTGRLAASPDVAGVTGVTGTFWSTRREVRCKFRDPVAIERVWSLVDEQLSG